MTRMLAAVTALALIWAGTWAFMAWSLRGDIETWFDDRRAEGWAAEYADLTVRGFPNRLDVTLSDIVLANPQSGTVWEAPFFQMFRLIYRPGHHILAFADTQQLGFDGKTYDLSSEGLRASVISDAEGRILRTNIEGQTLNISDRDGTLALAGFALGVSRAERAESYLLGLGIDGVAGPHSSIASGTAQAVTLRAVVDFDRPWSLPPQAHQPQPQRLDIRLAEFRANPLDLKLTGAVDLDPTGRATGDITLRADNWREGIARAKANNTVPDWLADLAETGLGAVAALGNGTSLDVTVQIENGQARLGLLPLGTLPLLRLP